MSEGVPVSATDELRERLMAELSKHWDEYDVCGCGEWFGLNNWFGHLTGVTLPIVTQAREDALEEAAHVAESDQIPRGRWKDYSPGYAHGYNVGRGHSAAAIRSLAGVTQPASRTIPCSRCDGQMVASEHQGFRGIECLQCGLFECIENFAVVAKARTEQREADAQIAESLASSQPMPCCVTHEIERRGGTYVAEKIAAALRGVGNQKVGVTVDDLALDEMDGNQNAEPRWSANRLEEVLREGLPDQNAEPEDKP